MKKLIFLTIFLMSGIWSQAQCVAPSGLTVKSGDISFYPTAGASVYELWFNSDTVPTIVSTPVETDRQEKFHYYASGKYANYYSIHIEHGWTLKVRAFCMPMWYDYDKKIWNYYIYKYDQSKFSQFSNAVIIK